MLNFQHIRLILSIFRICQHFFLELKKIEFTGIKPLVCRKVGIEKQYSKTNYRFCKRRKLAIIFGVGFLQRCNL